MYMHVIPNLSTAVIKPKKLGIQSKVAEFIYYIITNYQLKTILIVLHDEDLTDLIEQCS